MTGSTSTLARAVQQTPLLRPPRFERALVVAPHPDDEAVGCGGYLLRLAEQGGEITVLFMTDGERGLGRQAVTAAAAIRRDEAHAAARLLHVRRLVHWSLPDGDLSTDSGIASRISRLLRQLAAQVVLVPHAGEAHPDHAVVAQLAARLDARPDVRVMTYEVWTPQEPGCVGNQHDLRRQLAQQSTDPAGDPRIR